MRSHARARWRWLQVDGPGLASGALARFSGPPERWLPPGAEPRGRGHWRLTLSLGAVHRDVLVELGEVWRDGDEAWRTCSWMSQEEYSDWLPGPAWLPAFHGTIGVCGAPHDRIALEGMYAPPFGLAGRIADRLLLGRLARRSLREFLGAVAAGLGEAAQPPREASLPLRSAR